MSRVRTAVALPAALLAGAALAAPLSAASIPEGRGYATAPKFIGAPAVFHPIAATPVPANPAMAPNGKSNIHNDTWMSDSYPWAGPRGRKMKVQSVVARGECASITFNAKNQIIAVCLMEHGFVTLINPATMKVVTQTQLPESGTGCVGTNSRTTKQNDYAEMANYTEMAGGYFYLDAQGRAVVSTATKHLCTYRLSTSKKRPAFVVDANVDLTGIIPASDNIESALPDFSGNVWFVTKGSATQGGIVGVVNASTQVPSLVAQLPPGEQIANSFAIGTDGIYVISTSRLYKYAASSTGGAQVWAAAPYANADPVTPKPGQKSAGSGTTPTIMPGNRVAIVDNSDPENVVVYDTSTGNQICAVPVFSKGASATENSLVSINDSLIAENNYGNAALSSTMGGRTTTPGMARVDVPSDGSACHVAWTNTSVSAPSVVPKVSAKSGLIYTYSKPKGPGTTDRWYLTALDFATGKTRFSQLAGTGLFYNNSYASLYIAPNGAAYVGTLLGLVKLADGK